MALIFLTYNCVVQEVSGRIIRVEFAKSFKKPTPPLRNPPPGEECHVIYASNLAWKARSTHLRDIFTENFKEPLSARVVFESPAGRSTGYGFVSYPTVQEAGAAISTLYGKVIIIASLMVHYLSANSSVIPNRIKILMMLSYVFFFFISLG